jgi:hypothetical protein
MERMTQGAASYAAASAGASDDDGGNEPSARKGPAKRSGRR